MSRHLTPPELTDEQKAARAWLEDYKRTSPGADADPSESAWPLASWLARQDLQLSHDPYDQDGGW